MWCDAQSLGGRNPGRIALARTSPGEPSAKRLTAPRCAAPRGVGCRHAPHGTLLAERGLVAAAAGRSSGTGHVDSDEKSLVAPRCRAACPRRSETHVS